MPLVAVLQIEEHVRKYLVRGREDYAHTGQVTRCPGKRLGPGGVTVSNSIALIHLAHVPMVEVC